MSTIVVVNSIFAGLFLTGCVRTKEQRGNSTVNCMGDSGLCSTGQICVRYEDTETYDCVGCDAGTFWQAPEITYAPDYQGPVQYCVSACADGYWGDDDLSSDPEHEPFPSCVGCDSTCATCSDGNTCTSCADGLFLWNDGCIDADACTASYGYPEDGECKSCHFDDEGLRSCGTCDGPTEVNCVTCPGTLFIGGQDNIYMTPEGSCITEDECANGREHVLNDTHEPYTCDNNCSINFPATPYQTVNGYCVDDCGMPVIKEDDRCVVCPGPTPYRHNDPEGICLEQCPATFYADDNDTCQQCANETCLYCDASDPTRCIECPAELNLTEDGTCVNDDECTDPTLPVCNECPADFPLRIPETGACTDVCPDPTWADFNNICQDCNNTDCVRCNPENPDTCLECPPELNLTDGGLCATDEECQDEDLPDFCLECPEGLDFRLPDETCVAECPGNFYPEGDRCLECTNETICLYCVNTPELCSECPPDMHLTEDGTCISDDDCADPSLPECLECPAGTFRTVIGTCVADCGLAENPAQCETCPNHIPNRTVTGRCVANEECGVLQTGEECVTCLFDRPNRTETDRCVPDEECSELTTGDECRTCPYSFPNRTETDRCVADEECGVLEEGHECLTCPASLPHRTNAFTCRGDCSALDIEEDDRYQCSECPVNTEIPLPNRTETGRCVPDEECRGLTTGRECQTCPAQFSYRMPDATCTHECPVNYNQPDILLPIEERICTPCNVPEGTECARCTLAEDRQNDYDICTTCQEGTFLTNLGRCVADCGATDLFPDFCQLCPKHIPNRTETDRCVIDEECGELTTGDECRTCPSDRPNRTETDRCVPDEECSVLTTGDECRMCPRAFPNRTVTDRCVIDDDCTELGDLQHCRSCPEAYPFRVLPQVEFGTCTDVCPVNYHQPDEMSGDVELDVCTPCRPNPDNDEGCLRCELRPDLDYDHCISCQQDAPFLIPVEGMCVVDCDAYPQHEDCGVVVEQIETVIYLDDSGSMDLGDGYRLDMGIRALEEIVPLLDGRPVRVNKFGTHRHLLTTGLGRSVGVDPGPYPGLGITPRGPNSTWNASSGWTRMWDVIRADVPSFYLPGPGLLRVYIITDGEDNSTEGPNGFEGFKHLVDDLQAFEFRELQFHIILIDGDQDWVEEYKGLAEETGGSFVHYHSHDQDESDEEFTDRMGDLLEATQAANDRYDQTEDNTPGAGDP